VKVNKNTVPKKSTTYYAQWGKTLTTSEKRMVGTWNMKQSAGSTSLSVSYIFREDKTYSSLTLRISSDNRGRVSSSKSQSIGSWSVSGNTIHFTNRQFQSNNNNWMSIADSSLKLRLGSDEKGQYFLDDYDRKTYKS
jgi:hypothetical protein